MKQGIWSQVWSNIVWRLDPRLCINILCLNTFPLMQLWPAHHQNPLSTVTWPPSRKSIRTMTPSNTVAQDTTQLLETHMCNAWKQDSGPRSLHAAVGLRFSKGCTHVWQRYNLLPLYTVYRPTSRYSWMEMFYNLTTFIKLFNSNTHCAGILVYSPLLCGHT